MIEIDHVTKSMATAAVVDELSLSVPEGAFCVLLGPSGCGKSTTLRMINRLVPFDCGAIRVGGEDVRQVPQEALRRRIGYAIQSVGLFPHWRVEDNIATVPRLLGWPRDARPRPGRRIAGPAAARPRDISRTNTRISFPAASSSASAWRGRWPPTPICC